MSGSRLGRGRGGRLAIYGACGVCVLLLVFLYRAATTEMSRLRELHVHCVHQQETLAAQLQVIFEYKVRLEKALAEEKSSNAAVKQELQQRATREKSLRDKDSVEALRRFNSLQQTHKILESENQDLKEECDKQQKQALEDRKRLEVTLQELRAQIREARDENEKSFGQLKKKFFKIDTEKTRLEDRYNALFKTSADTNSTIEHLRKEVMQLNRELEENAFNKASSPRASMSVSQGSVQQLAQPNVALNNGGQAVVSGDEQQGARPLSQQQVSRPSNDVNAIAHPIQAPRDHQPIRDPEEESNREEGAGLKGKKSSTTDARGVKLAKSDETAMKLDEGDKARASIPLPYARNEYNGANAEKNVRGGDDRRVENVGDAPPKPVLGQPQALNAAEASSPLPMEGKKKSNDEPSKIAGRLEKTEGVENSQIRPEERPRDEEKPPPSGSDEIRDIQERVAGILNHQDANADKDDEKNT